MHVRFQSITFDELYNKPQIHEVMLWHWIFDGFNMDISTQFMVHNIETPQEIPVFNWGGAIQCHSHKHVHIQYRVNTWKGEGQRWENSLHFLKNPPQNEMPKGIFTIECTKVFSEFRSPRELLQISTKFHKLLLALQRQINATLSWRSYL